MTPQIKQAINSIVQGKNLSIQQAEAIMNDIMSGKATEAQISAFLIGLKMKKETADEITGFAKVMRQKATHIHPPKNVPVVDTCGTGGDNSHTFNISTAAGFVTAGAGIIVAKHGNRSVTSKSGSADVLEALGVKIDLLPEIVEKCLKDVGIAFLFAPMLHKAMKYAINVRREIGVRTVFNILGPLTNPANATAQVIGVYSTELTDILATVIGNLGVKKALVVAGLDGLDEITLSGPTKISEYFNGTVKSYEIDPKTFGFTYCKIQDLKVSDTKQSKDIIFSVLKGEKSKARDIVILNSAAALVAAEHATDFSEGIKLASDSIDSGKAKQKLHDLIEYTNK